MNAYVRTLVRLDDLAHDPWGTALSHQFGIAFALYHLGEDIPEAWQFSPGAAARDPKTDELPDAEYIALLADGDVTPAELRSAGTVLARYVRVAEAAGRSY